MQMRFYINIHKGLTFLWVLAVMAYFNSWGNETLWIYLALHGSYGIIWVLKDYLFGDKSWKVETKILYGVFGIWGGLSLYWITPVLIAYWNIHPPYWFLAMSVSIYTMGVFLHFTSDMQKYMSLEMKRGLITEGLWAYCRNPNYLGELFIYSGFSMLAMNWLPFLVLALFIIFYWIPNMIRKDKSLSRYPEFAAYKKKSWMFIPFIY